MKRFTEYLVYAMTREEDENGHKPSDTNLWVWWLCNVCSCVIVDRAVHKRRCKR